MLVSVAKKLGTAAGKIAALAGTHSDAVPAGATPKRKKLPKKAKARLPRKRSG